MSPRKLRKTLATPLTGRSKHALRRGDGEAAVPEETAIPLPQDAIPSRTPPSPLQVRGVVRRVFPCLVVSVGTARLGETETEPAEETYNLQRLGPLGFQDAVAALAVASSDLSGAPGAWQRRRPRRGGPRGAGLVWGSRAARRGVGWIHGLPDQTSWRPVGTKADAQWLWRQIRDELAEWAKPDSNRHEVPTFLVFVSNVPLSPDPTGEGLAFLQTVGGFFAELGR